MILHMSKNILVTGIAGFIGSHVARVLMKRGDNVTGVDNLNDYYSPDLKKIRLGDFLGDYDFKVHVINIEDKNELEKVFKIGKFDKVLHLAAQAGVRHSLTHPDIYVQANIAGFNNILELVKKYEIDDLIFASSSSVYGKRRTMPLSEDDSTDVPLSLYAASKKANELQAHAYHNLYGFNCWGLRFFTAYGPWGRPDMMLYKFLQLIENDKPIELYNKGNHLRDFTYITDLVSGIVAAIDKCQGYEIINIGNGWPIKLEYVVDVIELILGREIAKLYMALQPGDIERTHANIKKANKLLDYEPEVSIEHGIAECINWFNKYKGIL